MVESKDGSTDDGRGGVALPQHVPLPRSELAPDPVEQFREWFGAAKEHSGLDFADAACLATVDRDGWPEARIVLVKAFDERGFVFYTNRRSRKGESIERTPRAALNFYWDALARQITISGGVEPIANEDSDAYFATRPRGSQIGAWASRQSEPVPSREVLLERVREYSARWEGQDVPRPPHWGGYRVVPHTFEFWQGRPDRLHDRFLYRKSPDGGWKIDRLYP